VTIALLTRASSRHFIQHPWLTALALFSIALGVAVVTAVDLANQGAMDSLVKTTSALAGGATHQLIGPPGGIPEQIYPGISQNRNILHATPVVEGVVNSPEFPGFAFNLKGVDPLSQRPFRPHMEQTRQKDRLLPLLIKPGALFLSMETAQRFNLKIGDGFHIIAGGKKHRVVVVGLLAPENPVIREGIASLLLADIATAQELMGLEGRLSRIDLIIQDADQLPTLPTGIRIVEAANQQKALMAMTQSFRMNLSALSLLALLVGMFIIFNTVTFSVVRRRKLIGLLRAQGVTRREIFQQLLTEGLMLAIPATGVGLLFGVLLGHGMVELVTRTINDLYFHLPPTPLHIDYTSLLKGTCLGVGASLIATLPPAFEATAISPATALARSSQEQLGNRAKKTWTIWTGLTLLLLGVGVLLLPNQQLYSGFAAMALLIIGVAFLTPQATVVLMTLLRNPMSRLFGLPGKLAVGGVVRNLSRTGVAVAALSVAVATAIGMGLLIHSFRSTVEVWLEATLSSDIYISVSGTLSTSGNPELQPATIATLRKTAGVAKVGFGRKMVIETNIGRLKLLILDIPKERFFRYQFKAGNPETLWPQFIEKQSILISESLAYHKNLKLGEQIILPTPVGDQAFTIGGIIYDYRANAGLLIMNRANFQHYWQDNGVTNMGITVTDASSVDQVVKQLRTAIAGQGQLLVIRSNRKLREASLEIFDRTFAITRLLRLLGVVVAFFGVFTALMAIQLERYREMAIFRALGLTKIELWRIMFLETGLLGLASGLFAIPLGWLQGLLLIHVINYRSFGWSMQIEPDPYLLGQALLIAIPTALMAGIFPAYRMANSSPAQALREV
jgi:putative ABC transport system permease protein